MNVYMQTDPRWANLSYGGGSTMYKAGCGCCAIANLLGISPLTIRSYMLKIGGASYDEGTYHWAVHQAIHNFGYEAAKITTSSHAGDEKAPAFDQALQHLKDGKKMIFLMGGKDSSKPCKNNFWCRTGHYICVDGYKEENGIIYLRVLDSFYPAHSAWIEWKYFLGDIKHLWTTSCRWKEESKEEDDEMTVIDNAKLIEVFGYKAVVRSCTKDGTKVTDIHGKQVDTLNKGNKIRVHKKWDNNIGNITINRARGLVDGYIDCGYLTE